MRLLVVCSIFIGLGVVTWAQVPVISSSTVDETRIPVFSTFQPAPEEQTVEHPQVLANFRLHLEYRFPSANAGLGIRVHPSALVALPLGKVGEWRTLDLQYEQLVGKFASVVAEVDGINVTNIAEIQNSKNPQLTEQLTFPGGVPGVPTHLSVIASGGAELRSAWVQPLGDTDHAGQIIHWNEESMTRGKTIFTTLCVSCHGSETHEGSMPTSRKLHLESFKNGIDPFRLYQTISKGYGQMVPLPLPQDDRYAVIQYLREEILKVKNPSQYFEVDSSYLASLPRSMRTLEKAGPIDQTPFYLKMNFGPALHWTYQVSPDNIAYKGIAIRLDEGLGGVSKGRAWMLYDHDTMRVAAAWSGEKFIDWKGIAFDASHQTHASIVGDIAWANPVGPGWADPDTGSWKDPRFLGRDGKPYGPLPKEWSTYRGLYLHENRAVLNYTVGTTEVLDSPSLSIQGSIPVFTRILNIGPTDRPLALRVAPTDTLTSLRGEGGKLITQDGFTVLQLAADKQPRRLCLYISKKNADGVGVALSDTASTSELDLSLLTNGGPSQWPESLATQTASGNDKGPFRVDTLTLPDENPWHSFMRIGAFDFMPDGKSAALCTWNGDVWTVSGLVDHPTTLHWKRIASGLFQPLGLKVVQGTIYLTCRDQIAVLRDRNEDGEVDFIECFNNDAQVTEHFHEFAMGLQMDDVGNFYYAKSACHAKPAIVPQHGTLLRVSADGSHTDILAHGFRAANGVCLNPDGTFFVTDQEGHWTPKNRINRVVPDGGFYGNMLGYTNVTDIRDSAMRQPMCWITNAKDRSPAELLWVPGGTWGSLEGSLLNTSYGYGRLYVVPHESVGGKWQGAVVELPVPDFPTGIMRGRFHPTEGQLYTSGCAAWATNCQTPGGFYKVSRTSKALNVPIAIHARTDGLAITFSDPIDSKAAADLGRYHFKSWHLNRSGKYGSEHIDEKTSKILRATPLNSSTVLVEVENLGPSQCYELRYDLLDASNSAFSGSLHGTIHQLGTSPSPP